MGKTLKCVYLGLQLETFICLNVLLHWKWIFCMSTANHQDVFPVRDLRVPGLCSMGEDHNAERPEAEYLFKCIILTSQISGSGQIWLILLLLGSPYPLSL